MIYYMSLLFFISLTVVWCKDYEDDKSRENIGTEDMANLLTQKQIEINKIKPSEWGRKFVEHFKNPDAANMPLPIPDPFNMPDRIYPIVGFKVHTTEVTAYNVSRIRLLNMTADIVEMKVQFSFRMTHMVISGNYSFSDWLGKEYFGGFNVTLINAQMDCKAKLEITRDGELTAAEMMMDMVSRDRMEMKMENAGLLGFLINSFGDALFNSIKPYFLSLISSNIRNNMNQHLKKVKIMFPNSIAPIDLAIAEARKFVKKGGFDPYPIPDYQYSSGIYSVDVTGVKLSGLSSFYRIGDLKISMNEHHILHMVVSVGTEELEGICKWAAGIAGIVTTPGTTSFTVDYLHVMFSIDQSLDIRKNPQLVDLNIKVGNIQLHMDGAGMLDYVSEAMVNILPNLLRYQIIQAAEKPIRRKVQDAMDNLEVEQKVLDFLPMLDKDLRTNDNSSAIRALEDNFDESEVNIQHENDDLIM